METLTGPLCPECSAQASSFWREEHGFHLVEFFDCPEELCNCGSFAVAFSPAVLCVDYKQAGRPPRKVVLPENAQEVRCPDCEAVLCLEGPIEGDDTPTHWEAYCSTAGCRRKEYLIELIPTAIDCAAFSRDDARAFDGHLEEYRAWLNGDGPAEWEIAEAALEDVTSPAAIRYARRKEARDKLELSLVALGVAESATEKGEEREIVYEETDCSGEFDDDLTF